MKFEPNQIYYSERFDELALSARIFELSYLLVEVTDGPASGYYHCWAHAGSFYGIPQPEADGWEYIGDL